MDKRLEQAHERRNLVFVVGAGFSAAVTDSATFTTWRGLITDGIERAAATMKKPNWKNLVLQNLAYGFEEGDMNMVLSAATSVVKELQEIGEYAYSKWLQETVGSFDSSDHILAKRLRALPYPLLTTNYDSLLDNNSRRGTDWTKPREMQALLAGTDSRDVGHLHGKWDNTSSVILTEKHYDDLLESEAAQAIQQAASTLKSLVYVGFGSGLEDPNFSKLIEWHRSKFIPSAVDHFRLCRNSDLESLRAEHANDHIIPVAYGAEYSDLEEFLKQFTGTETAELSTVGIARDIIGELQRDFEDEMKLDSILGDAIEDAESRSLDELVLPPVLLPVPHSEYIRARAKRGGGDIERLDASEEVRHGDVLLIAAEENTGLTTALKWLTLEASKYLAGSSPIYIPFSACRRQRHPFKDAIQIEAFRRQLIRKKTDPLPPHVVALDSFSPFVDRVSESTLTDVKNSDALLTIIGCVQGTEDDIVERLEHLGVSATVRYLGKLSAADVRDYSRLASPSNHSALADQVLMMLQAENLPRTPFTVSLLISVFLQGGKFAANASQTSILDDYIGLLLGRGDPHEDARFGLDQSAREALLSALAERFVEAEVGGLSEVDVQAVFEAAFNKFAWTESTSETLNNFVARHVLRRRGNHVEFARSSFLHLFAAKRAIHDSTFRELLLERPMYYSSAITDYAALYRHDADLLARLNNLLDKTYDVTRRASMFDEIALAAPRRLASTESVEPGEPAPDGGDPTVTEEPSTQPRGELKDVYFDSVDDNDLPPFPTVDEDEVPVAFQLLRTLELVSTVLRDSDQIEDLNLKQEVLKKVLNQWAVALDVIHEDSSFYDFVKTLIVDLELVRETEDEADVLQEVSRAVPAAIVLNEVGTTLSSRKLLRLLDRVTSSEGGEPSEELIVMASFFHYALAEPGWPAKLTELLEGRGNIWIIRNFLLHFLLITYVEDEVPTADAETLLELSVSIIQKAIQYRDETERRQHATEIREDLQAQRLRARMRRKLTAAID